METLTAFLTLLQQSVVPVFNVFKEPNVAVGVAATLVAIAALIFVYLIFFVMLPTFAKLKLVIRAVEKTGNYDDFKAHFSEIDKLILNIDFLKHGWREFKETLVIPHPSSTDPIKNTSRPYDYIHLAAAESSGMHLKIFSALPNYFVGFGLLFTFLGLVAALYFASAGVDGQTVKETQDALGNLLSAATFKFLTSIAGLFSSLFLSISYKLSTERLQTLFNRFSEALEHRLLFATSEDIALQILRENKEQTLQLQKFNTDFAFSVASAIEGRLKDTLTESLVTAIQPIADGMSSLAKNIGGMNQDALGKMVESFQDTVQGAAGKEMEATAKSLQETQATLAGLSENLDSSSQKMNETLSQTAKDIKEAFESTAKLLENNMGNAARNFEDQIGSSADAIGKQLANSGDTLAGRLDGASENIANVLAPLVKEFGVFNSLIGDLDKKLALQSDALSGVVEKIRNVSSSLEVAATTMRRAGEPVTETAQKMTQSATAIERSSEAMISVQNNLSNLSKGTSEAVERISGTWDLYKERFEKVDQDLEQAFKNITSGVEALREKDREFAIELSDGLNKAVKSLGGSIEDLSGVAEEIVDGANKIAKAMS